MSYSDVIRNGGQGWCSRGIYRGILLSGQDSAHSFATFTNRERVEAALPHGGIIAKSRTIANEGRSGWLSAGTGRAGTLTPWPQINDAHDYLSAMA